MKRNWTSIYHDWIKPLSKIPEKDFKKLMMAILNYDFNGTEPPNFENGEFEDITVLTADFIFPALKRSKTNSINGAKGGNPGLGSSDGLSGGLSGGSSGGSSLNINRNINKNNNTETNNKREINKRENISKKFIKPTLEEVKSYIKENGYHTDPEMFIDFYESKGWKVGNQPMKDWKAAIRTWERKNNKTENNSTSSSFDTDEFFQAALERSYGKEFFDKISS